MNMQALSHMQEVALSGTPSNRFNNLSLSSSSSSLVAYVDKENVRVDDLSDKSGKLLPIRGARAVTLARFISIDCLEYLGVTSDVGLHLFDATGETLLATFKIENFPENDDCKADPSRSEYCCGVSGIHGTPLLVCGSSQGNLAVLHYDRKRKSFDLESTLKGHRRSVCTVETSVSHIVSGDELGMVIVWNSNTLEQQCQFPSMGPPCSSICIRANTVVAAFVSGVVRVYFINECRVKFEVDSHCRALNAMDLHPFHDVFATVGEDGVINVWKLPDKRSERFHLVSSEYLEDHMLVGVSFAKDNTNKVATTSYDRKSLIVRY
mmetsp:Transcript_6671/g.10516  ORF Transcript_6671/g.10516 Transcript_6671/m.10516 type:complete len:322 (+) Transcript_6671:198-1163(+)